MTSGIVTEIERWQLARLIPYARTARSHCEEQVEPFGTTAAGERVIGGGLARAGHRADSPALPLAGDERGSTEQSALPPAFYGVAPPPGLGGQGPWGGATTSRSKLALARAHRSRKHAGASPVPLLR